MTIITPAVRGRLGRKTPGAQGKRRHRRAWGVHGVDAQPPRPHGFRLLTGSFSAKHLHPSTPQSSYPVCYGLNWAPPHLTGASPTLHVPVFGGRGFKKAIKVRWGHNSHGTGILTRRDARMVWTRRRGHMRTQRGCSVCRSGRAFFPGPTWAWTPSLQNRKQTPPAAQDALSWQPLQSNTRGTNVIFEESPRGLSLLKISQRKTENKQVCLLTGKVIRQNTGHQVRWEFQINSNSFSVIMSHAYLFSSFITFSLHFLFSPSILAII